MTIETKGLTKTYRRFEKQPGIRGSVKSLFHRQYVSKTAVDHLDLRIDEGEFVGLIGPNGAGKTTLVKMLTGIIAPSEGAVSVLGYCPNKLEKAFKRQYAVVMGQKSQLFFELTPADTLLLFKELYGISDAAYRQNLDYFVGLFDVGQFMNVQVRTLSLGERMKMELIVALLHNPRVLFLDEPTIGLDAVAQRQIRLFLRQVNRDRGTTILLTSHYMEDIQALCARSVLIGSGRKLYDGTTDALFARYQTHRVVTISFAEETQASLPDGALLLERTPHKLRFRIEKERTRDAMQQLLASSPLCDVKVEEDEIGSVVESIYREMGVRG